MSTKTELLALMGAQNESLNFFFEVADDIGLRYYDGGTEIDVDKLADKLVTWLAVRDAAIARTTLHAFADQIESGYALDCSSPDALLRHVVGLAHRNANLAGA